MYPPTSSRASNPNPKPPSGTNYQLGVTDQKDPELKAEPFQLETRHGPKWETQNPKVGIEPLSTNECAIRVSEH